MDLPSPTRERLPALLALATGMGVVGTSMTANKFIVGELPIMLASGARFAIATIVLLVLVRMVENRLPRIPRRLHLVLVAQAFFGVFGFNVLVLLGVDMTTATISGIITAMTPAMIAVISFGLGDRLGPGAWVGVALTIAGVVLVNLLATPPEDAARRPLLGATLIFLAVVGEALYTVLGRHVATKISPLATATFICIYGFAMFLPFALRDLWRFDPGSASRGAWIAVAYLAIVVTVFAFVIWFVGLRIIPASTAGAFTGMIPITAVLSAWLVLGERIGWAHVAGIALVLAGILLVARSRGKALPGTGERATVS
jgi:drug/metabolite transporter (DMT)-like permease